MNALRSAVIGAISLICTVLLPMAASAEGLQVVGMAIQPRGVHEGEVITLKLSQPVLHRAFLLPDPPRMVIDLPPFQWRVSAEDLKQYNGQLIENVRYARFDDQISRVVLDLNQSVVMKPLSDANAPTAEISYQLQGIQPVNAPEVQTPPSAPKSLKPTPWRSKAPVMISPYDRELEAIKRPAVAAPPSGAPSQGRYAAAPFSATPTPQNKPTPLTQSEVPAAQQEAKPVLPLKPLIVIDAGHGGQDPGTIGRNKTHEKTVTLDYAKALKNALESSGKYRVALTRSDDRFILLRERFHIARRMKANLFVSLHADSALNSSARGLSVYTVSEESSDAEAEALAAQENKVDVLAEINLDTQDQDVADILIDLAQRDTKNKSILLAEHIVEAMQGKVALLNNTHRYAGFAVLKAPDIPSALVEIGFLSHPEEEQVIQSSRHREHVVQGLVQGITNYFAEQRSHE